MSLKNPDKIQSFFFRTPFEYDLGMNQNHSIFRFSHDKQAQFRFEVIDFHHKWGLKATIDTYKVSKPTVYRWKSLLSSSSGRLESLIPKSKAPTRRRTMLANPKIVEFIKSLREEHYRLGKEKIKPILDDYCLKEGLEAISTSKIGRIIKKNHLFFQKLGRYYHNPAGGFAKRDLSYKTKVKFSPKVTDIGYVEIDTITRFIIGLKVYVFNAVDIKLKFQFSYAYKSLSSATGLDFFKKLEQVYPIYDGIKTIQTDNGLEFHGEFRKYLLKKNINHLFIYPRCPKINGFVERANRTLSEEFLQAHLGTVLLSFPDLNHELMDYLVWYNTVRVHKSLGNISPINYLLKISPESQMYWTHTSS
jgi:transposase InsO family protein